MSEIISWEDLPDHYISSLRTQRSKRGNPGRKNAGKYLNIVTAFDIETTPVPGREEAGMYIWQWQFGLDYTVMGRTWDELRCLLAKLDELMPKDRVMIVLVHNLAYEFQFLRTVYEFQPDEVFAVESRRVLKCTMMHKRFEYRCTYLHSNMSLRAYLKKMNVEHQKTELDYEGVRYPWTPLTDEELEYCQNDVLGLVEAYTTEMKRDRDRIATMPMTSTGYVRRNAKRAMRMVGPSLVASLQPDYEQYKLLRSCFRGGNTHSNRYMAGRILENVSSADRSSSYPDVICNRKFPMTKFRWLENPCMKNIRYHLKKGKAVAFTVAVWDVILRDPGEGFPYIPRSKCTKIVDGVFDNGRVLKAAYLETSMTDVDFRIFERQYRWSHIKGIRAMWSHYGELPRPLVLCAIEYYEMKTKLKGVTSEDGSTEYLYAKAKELLNSLYQRNDGSGSSEIQYRVS